jgi:UDP-3-O-[3-hydroxymyristoyl] glucosamine N-acyltransferase
VTITLRKLAALVDGTVEGDGDLEICFARTLQDAQSGDITFLDKINGVALLERSKATAAVAPLDLPKNARALIRVPDPLLAFVTIFQHLQGKKARRPSGIDPRALIDESACIGADPSIHASAVIGANTIIGQGCILGAGTVIGDNCRLGEYVHLYPNVVLYDDTVLGDRVIIHANAVLGSDGFGYRLDKGRHVKVPHLGNVVVGNDVEIGAGATIDRGTFQSTTIGDGTKIDNLVQIAHNCRIGKHNAFAAQVGIAGSSTTGNYVFMGGQAGVRDHIKIGDGAVFGAKTGVFHDVAAGKRMFLYPEVEERDAGRILACLKKLPHMRKDLLRVLKQLNLAETKETPPTALLPKPAN